MGSERYIIHPMNKIYSRDELNYKPRWLTDRIQQAVVDHPIVVLTGARQVGKSTLLQHASPMQDWRYVTMDNADTLAQALSHPESLWAGTLQIVIDETQKAPAILSAIKQAVDHAGRRELRFLISGSANLLLMKQVSESLAGRAVYLVLNPMTIGEQLERPAPNILSDLLAGTLPSEGPWPEKTKISVAEWLLRGFLPPLFDLPRAEVWSQWWEGYVGTYLERDLRQIANIDTLTDFRRVMQLAALRTGQILNQTEVARDARVSQPTTHRYLNLLEATHLAQRVSAYGGNRGTAIIKSPKWFWLDSGLAAYLCGFFDEQSLRQSREYGALFENLIYHHLAVLAQLITPRPIIHYWRTRRGDEVDFVIERGRQLLAIEVKMTDTIRFADATGLHTFIDLHPETSAGVLLYSGEKIQRISEKVVALPWQMIAL